MNLRESIKRAKETGDLNILIRAIPYARFLGITGRVFGDEVIAEMRFSEKLIGNPRLPALHGGTVGALLESAAIFKLLWDQETDRVPKTINITVSYLRSAKPVATFAQPVITRQGRRVANVRVEAWQQERQRPVAVAHAHFLLVPAGEGPGGAKSG
jgi:uncharacterized protein (TIGR00369 family)